MSNYINPRKETTNAAKADREAPNYYAAAYPNGIGQNPRTLRVFKGLATRQAWIAARMTDIPAAPGYRATVQACDITPTERRAINQALSLTITRA